MQTLLVHLVLVAAAGEEALCRCQLGFTARGTPYQTYGLEHVQGCNGNALGSLVDSPVLHALVLPFCASTGIQQDADQEKVKYPLALLRVVNILPRRQKVGDPVAPTDTKVLVPAVSRDAREGRIVVSL